MRQVRSRTYEATQGELLCGDASARPFSACWRPRRLPVPTRWCASPISTRSAGPLAETGQLGEQHFRFAIDRVNAAHAAGPGRTLELVPMDNEVSPEKSLTLLRKAVDDGIHYVTQGNGSAVAFALADAISKNNKRDPAKSVDLPELRRGRPGLTNDKCSWWHFRFDADSDMKMRALADYLVAQKDAHKVYIFNPDYSFGVSVEKAASQMLTGPPRRPGDRRRRAGAAGQGEGFHALHRQVPGRRRRCGGDRQLGPGPATAGEGGGGQRLQGPVLHLLPRRRGAGGRRRARRQGRRADQHLGRQRARHRRHPDAFEKRFGRTFYYWHVVNEIDIAGRRHEAGRFVRPGQGRRRAQRHEAHHAARCVGDAGGQPPADPAAVHHRAGAGPAARVQGGRARASRPSARSTPDSTRMPTTCVYKDKP